jgi:hypothetical protein
MDNGNLESKVKHILIETSLWMKKNSERRSWVQLNFSSFFLHACNSLKGTNHFPRYYNTKFMKSRNLEFYIDENGYLKHVSFYNSERLDSIYALNSVLKEQLPEILEWVKEVEVEKFTQSTVSEKLSFNTKKLDSIHF